MNPCKSPDPSLAHALPRDLVAVARCPHPRRLKVYRGFDVGCAPQLQQGMPWSIMSARLFHRAAPASRGSLVAGGGGGRETLYSVSRTFPNNRMLDSALLNTPFWPTAAPMPSVRASREGHHQLLLRPLSPSKRSCCRTTPAQLAFCFPIFLQAWTGRASPGHSVSATWHKVESLQLCVPQSGCSVLSELLEEEAILACLVNPCKSPDPSLAHAWPRDLVAVARCPHPRRLKVYKGFDVGCAPQLQQGMPWSIMSARLFHRAAPASRGSLVAGGGGGRETLYSVSRTFPNNRMLDSALLNTPFWPTASPMPSVRASREGHHQLLLRPLSPSKRSCCRTTSSQLLHSLVLLQASSSSLATVWATGHTVQSRFETACGLPEKVRLPLESFSKKLYWHSW